MPIKITQKKIEEGKIRQEILSLYLEGISQKEIYNTLKEQISGKKLKVMIQESEFLSPKNFRLGAILAFLITLLTPPISVYLRGFEYQEILDIIFMISASFSLPFILFAIALYMTKDLKWFVSIVHIFLFYYIFIIFLLVFIANDIKIWTIPLFHIVILPTLLSEYFKLIRLKNEMSSKHKNSQ